MKSGHWRPLKGTETASCKAYGCLRGRERPIKPSYHLHKTCMNRLRLCAKHGSAKHVWAVEAVPGMAHLARRLVQANGLAKQVTVLEGKVEDVRLPSKVAPCTVSLLL